MGTRQAPAGAPWLRRAFQELNRRQHIVLHGPTDDLVRWDDTYVELDDAIYSFLSVVGFEVIGSFDLADGLTFRDESHRELFDSFRPTEPVANAHDSDQPGASTESERERRLRMSREVLFEQVAGQDAASLRRPADALSAIRLALSTSEQPIAIVIEAADLLLGATSHGDALYREYLMQLRKAFRDAHSGPAGENGPQNTLILTCSNLSALPTWLHESNPRVAVVQIEPPGPAERSAIIHEHKADFSGVADLAETALDDAVAALSMLTDGMGVLDLLSLATTSQVAEIPISEAKRLVLHHRTGLRSNPWSDINIERIRDAHDILASRVHGQPVAVQAVADMLINANVGLDFVPDGDSASTRPRGVFFFVGPTGVGKTELAKAVAKLLFDDEAAISRYDMSEYAEEHAAERLTGAPPGYVGHESGGALTNWVMRRPFSIVLFDEIEKAHPRVFDKFLQIIDDGRLTDGHGRTAYFSNTVVIFTSNLGSGSVHSLLDSSAPSLPPYEEIKDSYLETVTQFFTHDMGRPELLARLGGGVVVFDILRTAAIRRITHKFLNQIENSARSREIVLVIDRQPIIDLVMQRILSDGARLGARQIRDPLLEDLLRTPLNRWVLDNKPAAATQIIVTLAASGDKIVISEVPRHHTPKAMASEVSQGVPS